MTIKSILVPVDYSEYSRTALSGAAAFAEAFGASIDVVHVWDRPQYVSETVVVHGAGGETRSLIDMIRENAELEMETFLSGVKVPANVRLSHRLLSGEPTSTLLREIKERGYDLVVVGTHGRTGFSHLLLGSVAEKLVRLSPVPVLTVPTRREHSDVHPSGPLTPVARSGRLAT
jgi:nucleotide-binding universal stress UspA family protein